MPTYTPIQSIQLTEASSSVTFSNIPQIYQDLVLVVTGYNAVGDGYAPRFQFNGDTSNLYSFIYMGGTGSSYSTGRRSTGNTIGYIATSWIGGWSNTSTNTGTFVLNFFNYSSSTTLKTVLSRASIPVSSYPSTEIVCGLWQSTNPVTSIRMFNDASQNVTYAAGTTFDLYGISPVAANNAQAAGGTDIFYDSTYVYHAFKGSGTFTPYRNLTADIMVIAGGGAGGYGYGAGGGAGGNGFWSSQSLTASTSYTVTVGAGGVGRTTEGQGASGSNSQFGSLTASVGGGGGGGGLNGNGANGGSGGGGARDTGTGGTATSGQGNAGRNASSGSYAGGGGGAGATGDTSGNGGAGTSAYSLWGLATGTGQNVSGTYFFAGGGAGYRADAAATTGGSGGGGNSGSGAGTAMTGTAFTGGGGGAWDASALPSGSGGSGIVIVRYAR